MQLAASSASGKVLFTGEMVFPWMFEDLAGLRPFRELAHLVARHDGWSSLYDSATLRQNIVPVAAATYVEVCSQPAHGMTRRHALHLGNGSQKTCAPASLTTSRRGPSGRDA